MLLQSIPIPSQRLKISDNDTTPDFLSSKLLQGSGVSLIIANDGANENLTIANTDTGSAAVSAHLSAFSHAPLSSTAFTAGSVLFSNGTTITQDNANFFIDIVNKRLGIALTSPTRRVDILDTTNPQIRLTHTAGSVYGEMQALSTGVTAFTTTGNAFTMTGATLALGKSVEVATKHRQTHYLLDGTDVMLVRQTHYWNGSAFTTDYSMGCGQNALSQNSGSSVNGFGYGALTSNTGASSNAFGESALASNTGIYSNGFGRYALFQNTGATTNGLGGNVLFQNTGANANGFGHFALYQNIGSNATGIGYSALYQNTGSNANGVGYSALRNNNWPQTIVLGNQSTTYFPENAASTKTFTETAIDATAKTITIASHGFGSSGKVNLKFKVVSGTAPGGLTNNSIYQFTLNSANVLYYSGITSIGSGTFSLTNSVDITNTVVIGHETNATKANQVVLGNASITETLLRGNTGIDTSPTSKLDVNGDIETLSTGAVYFGDPTTDGTWRIVRNGANLEIQKRESGAYVAKTTVI